MRCCRNRREIQFYCQKQTSEQKPEQFKPDEGEISPSLEVRLDLSLKNDSSTIEVFILTF